MIREDLEEELGFLILQFFSLSISFLYVKVIVKEEDLVVLAWVLIALYSQSDGMKTVSYQKELDKRKYDSTIFIYNH